MAMSYQEEAETRAATRHVNARLECGDLGIDGGNSCCIGRARELTSEGVLYVDVGTCGGVRGLERCYCTMIGGEPEPVYLRDPICARAPRRGDHRRTSGSEQAGGISGPGYLRCDPSGGARFVKMVHSGI
jgi:6-phosphogluconate dehydrogenase